MVSIDDLPLAVRKNLEQIAEKKGRDLEEIVAEFFAFKVGFEDVCRQMNWDDDRCLKYSVRSFTAFFMAKPMPKMYKVLVLGYTNPRISKSTSKLMARIYGVLLTEEPKPVVIVMLDNGVVVRELEPMTIYRMRLPSQVGERVFLDDLTFALEKSLKINIDQAEEILKQYTEYKRFTLKEVWRSFSRIDESTGYVDEWSWRGIRGFIVDYREGLRDDETKWAYYEIADETNIEEFDEEGNPVPKKIRVWIHPRLARYDVKSEVFIYGHLVPPRKEGDEPFMNGFGVLPGEITFPRGV